MKKLIVCALFLLFMLPAAWAQKKQKTDTATIEQILEELLEEQTPREKLKSYYDTKKTADLCESWSTCAHWAFERYCENQTFKITKAVLCDKCRVNRHSVTNQTTLYVEAQQEGKQFKIVFLTPHYTRGHPKFLYVARPPHK